MALSRGVVALGTKQRPRLEAVASTMGEMMRTNSELEKMLANILK